jgi:hypothetical protein
MSTRADRQRHEEKRKALDPEIRRIVFENTILARAQGTLVDRRDPVATSYHEAAHVVLQEAFGCTVKWASCEPGFYKGEKELGHFKSDSDKVLRPAILIAVELLSGDFAEWSLIMNESLSLENARISSSDERDLVHLFQRMNLKQSEYAGMYGCFAGLTAQLILLSGQWIHAIANLIYVHKKVTGEEIRETLRAKDFYRDDNPLFLFRNEAVSRMVVAPEEIAADKLPAAA